MAGFNFDSGISDGFKRTIYSPGSRSAPEDRRIRNWPLSPVEMDVRVTEDDFGGEWPPPRLKLRQDRIALYECLQRGDMSYFVKDASAVSMGINYFGRFDEVMATMMISAMPPREARQVVSNGTSQMVAFGIAFVTNVEGVFRVYKPGECFVDDSGEWLWIVRPYVSLESTDGTPDRAEVLVIPRERGTGTRWDTSWEENRIGALDNEESVSEGAWAVAPRPPEISDGDLTWGQSAFDSIIPPAVGIALALSRNDSILAAHQFPTLIIPAPFADAKSAILNPSDKNPDTFTNMDIQQGVRNAFMTNDVIWTPDGVNTKDAKYLTWDGNMEASFAQLGVLKQEMRMLLGIAAALEQESGDVASGAALRQMNFFLLAHGMLLHSVLDEAIVEVGGPSIPNPFQMDEAPAVPETDPESNLPEPNPQGEVEPDVRAE